MRAKGEIKDFEGGMKSQRDHLNKGFKDHNELVKDVADLARKQQNWDGVMELIYVDLGAETQEVTFRVAEVNGVDAGPLEPEA